MFERGRYAQHGTVNFRKAITAHHIQTEGNPSAVQQCSDAIGSLADKKGDAEDCVWTWTRVRAYDGECFQREGSGEVRSGAGDAGSAPAPATTLAARQSARHLTSPEKNAALPQKPLSNAWAMLHCPRIRRRLHHRPYRLHHGTPQSPGSHVHLRISLRRQIHDSLRHSLPGWVGYTCDATRNATSAIVAGRCFFPASDGSLL